MSDQDILLETGTNELEILELIIGEQIFGVNVLKIKQILSYDPETVAALHAPDIHPAVRGTFFFHGTPILLTDLGQYLFGEQTLQTTRPQVVVVCEFNNAQQGFLINGVENIFRRSWDQIQAPNSIISENNAMITGIVSSGDREVLLIDFEGIADDITGGRGLELGDSEETGDDLREKRAQVKLMLADDSSTVRFRVGSILRAVGYTDLTIFDNGGDAYEALTDDKNEPFDAIITDIEMPRMDGLTLCRKLKEGKSASKVIVLSSMISEQVAIKCRKVGADAYLSKEQTNELPALIDEHCLIES